MNKYFGHTVDECDDCAFKRINTIELLQMISLNPLENVEQTLNKFSKRRQDLGHEKPCVCAFQWIPFSIESKD